MNQSLPKHDSNEPIWVCVQSEVKREHIAAAHLLRAGDEIEVFNPRLRIRRLTKRGLVWFTEGLFPSYLFARFCPAKHMQSVKATPSVRRVVKFGLHTPSIPVQVIDSLRTLFDQTGIYEVPDAINPGDEITIASGPFQGLSANVLRITSGATRVQVLLDMLGRITLVELGREQILTQKSVPEFLACA